MSEPGGLRLIICQVSLLTLSRCAAHCEPALQALRTRDYSANAINIPSIGTDDASRNGNVDVTAIRDAIEAVIKQDKDVILVMHSFGGFTGSRSLVGLEKSLSKSNKNGVVLAVFLSAFLIRHGSNMTAALSDNPPTWIELTGPDVSGEVTSRLNVRNDNIGQGNFCKPNDTAADVLYNDLNELDRKQYSRMLKQQSVAASNLEMLDSCWKSELPKLYIHTTKDLAVPMDLQKTMLEGVQDDSWTVREMDGGHSCFVSKKEETASVMIDVLEELVE
ncbi:MAG: hypothetical protein M1828_005937 [Chrysothrix sp. TS-e1954]|nr:MAG: hypothetical protein M1828_005937 [Chrysothrix sp. TS-e1954]